jgi:hypothetical protein
MIAMKESVCRAAVLAFGMIAVLGAKACADEAIDSTRETIIQSVRDDVRRKIPERNQMPAENRSEVASEAKPSTNAPAHSNPKPAPK